MKSTVPAKAPLKPARFIPKNPAGRPPQADPPGRNVPAEYKALAGWYATRRRLFNIAAIAEGTGMSHTMTKELVLGTRHRAFAWQLDRLYAYFRAQLKDPAPSGWKPPRGPEGPPRPSAESAETP